MKWFMYLFALILVYGSESFPTQPLPPKGPEGPPVTQSWQAIGSQPNEPMPPAIEDFDLKSPPAPPVEGGPSPPAPPDPFLLSIFEKDPVGFPAAFIQWQQQQQQQKDSSNNREKRRTAPNASKRRAPTYDQFITAAVVSGLNLQQNQRSTGFTMFAPSDLYLANRNISLPLVALKDVECVKRIVRSHVVLGRLPLTDATQQDVALSLADTPIFYSSKEAGGVEIVRANIEADYGLVHIIGGLMSPNSLIDSCASLATVLSQGQQQHSISQRKVSDFSDENDEFFQHSASSINAQEINSLFNNNQGVEPLGTDDFHAVSSGHHSSGDEANVPLELLVNIDNFANAVKLTWQTEDSVITTLQNLGASTFLALLERTELMQLLTGPGPWTVFAPDNNAWQALPEDSFNHIVKDPILLEQILSYHIVRGNNTRKHLRNDYQRLDSLSQDAPIHVNLYSDGWASWYSASGTTITDLDEMAGNGVVHVVGSVLFPPLGDLYSTVKWTPALQTAFTLLQSLVDEEPDLFTDTSLTAFFPVDSPELNASLTKLTTSELKDIARRHVVRGTWFVSGLIDGDRLPTFSNSSQPLLSVSHDISSGQCLGVGGACILVRDITLTNGVLHVIDRLTIN